MTFKLFGDKRTIPWYDDETTYESYFPEFSFMYIILSLKIGTEGDEVFSDI